MLGLVAIKYFHELTQEEFNELNDRLTKDTFYTWEKLAMEYPQPIWCDLPDAVLHICPKLFEIKVKNCNSCKDCEYCNGGNRTLLEDVAIENIAIGTKVRSRLNGHHGEVFKVYNGREDFDIFIKWDNGKESVCWHFQGGNIEVLSE